MRKLFPCLLTVDLVVALLTDCEGTGLMAASMPIARTVSVRDHNCSLRSRLSDPSLVSRRIVSL